MTSFMDYIHSGQLTVSNLLLGNYSAMGLTTEEMMLWLQLSRKNIQGDTFPDLIPLAKEMNISKERIFFLLNQLVEKDAIEIKTTTDKQGRKTDIYLLEKIYEKLFALLDQKEEKQQEKAQELQVKELYQSFEQEFGRSLSPMEYQRVGQWLEEDKYQPELIQLALREAVLNQAYNLNYVDRILLSWERKNITTKVQVQKEQARRKEILLQKEAESKTPKTELPKVSLYNWLKEEGQSKNDK